MSRGLIRAALAAVFFSLAWPGAAARLQKPPTPVEDKPYVDGELLVGFRETPGRDWRRIQAQRLHCGEDDDALRRALHLSMKAELLSEIRQIRVHRIRLAPGTDVREEAKRYGRDPLVEYAEPNYRHHACAFSPSDIYFKDYQWYADKVEVDLAFDAWKSGILSFDSDVAVAVLDTGVGPHPEIDSQLLAGINTVNGQAVSFTADDSVEGHGTFAAGLIAALTDNGAGIAGVFFDSSRVKIQPVKVLDAAGNGASDDVAEGVIWAADNGARVINLSLSSGEFSSAVESACTHARGKGAFLVAASGNENKAVQYPAAYSNVMAVGALAADDTRAWYSNFGGGKGLDISAPGGDGNSTEWFCQAPFLPVYPEMFSLCAGGKYSKMAGTSFAAPLVSAAAALLISQDASRSPETVYNLLIQNTDPAAYGAGYSDQAGWGRLNVYRALVNDAAKNIDTEEVVLKAYNWPNPFSPDKQGLTTLTFKLAKPAEVKIRIFDPSGDLVFQKDLAESKVSPGYNMLSWDGRNGAGRVVANGTYLLKVSAGGWTKFNRVAVLR